MARGGRRSETMRECLFRAGPACKPVLGRRSGESAEEILGQEREGLGL